jgi:UDP-3-O-[3-hydroxymyristoyl] glucosamine N-acyltransferase
MPELTVAQLAEACGGEVQGDAERLISGANTLEQASETDLAFAEHQKAWETAARSRAGCLLIAMDFKSQPGRTCIRVNKPRPAFARLLGELYPQRVLIFGIHPTAVIARSAVLPTSCFVGPYVVIGDNTVLGEECRINAGCRIGNGVSIGAETVLHANVTLYDNVRLGSRVVLHAGCVIGADGFGYTFSGDHYEKFPQVGSVDIGDDVELGANCCVDRAALGVTRIGNGTKLDNLVHVAHNCTLGTHVVVAAQTGFSGSVTVGDYAMIGGQAGIGEKAKIDARAIVGGKAGILTSQHIAAGEPVWGIPARPLKQHLRGLAHVSKLPKTEQEIKQIKTRLSALEQQGKPA